MFESVYSEKQLERGLRQHENLERRCQYSTLRHAQAITGISAVSLATMEWTYHVLGNVKAAIYELAGSPRVQGHDFNHLSEYMGGVNSGMVIAGLAITTVALVAYEDLRNDQNSNPYKGATDSRQ
jgi:hypothetical protein